MSDSNIFNQEEEQKASQAIEDKRDVSSDVSNAAQKSPDPSVWPRRKGEASERSAKRGYRAPNALHYGPADPDARFWGILATSRRNRSLNRVSRRLRRSECERNRTAKSDISCRRQNEKNNGLSDVSSRDKFGEASFRAEPLHSPESDITPTPLLHNAVTIVEVYELLLASCAKILARFRAKLKKEKTV
ncbi:uncharacterized protein EAE98_002605 [Botrytis deweyae]|uniref:Uncharacterized protein n=1 Tax=Botrytis deweyae TaxID=2478750 RepID=A0ABQ7IXV2_9HELO|nr:uncharacterized protein EAE98_002605 [Botrytis deweyae]KAF7936386.1 hypothetical protein EAE98_002605 [Botrytis deweyae]